MKKSIIPIPIIQASLAAIVLMPLTSTFATGCFVRADCKPTSTELIKGYEFDGRSLGIEIPAGRALYQCGVIMPAKSFIDLAVAINHKSCPAPILGGKAGMQRLLHTLHSGDFISFTQMKHKIPHRPKLFTDHKIVSPHYVLQCDVLVSKIK